MAQYRVDKDRNWNANGIVYEVNMQADENGELTNRRYNRDAWNRPKSIIDRSIFSATWTFGIPERVWEEYVFDGSTWTPQQGFTNASVVNKMLNVNSGTGLGHGTTIATKEYTRYQPNRGQLYSTAVLCPDATTAGTRRFGLATPQDGVFFEVVGDGTEWDIFAGRRSYGTLESYVSIKETILANIPDFDPSKGHVYDIQYQWRGVGNYFFYVDLQLVYTEENLGTMDSQLSMSDPALQPFFSAYCGVEGTAVNIQSGCVDVSSEGGRDEETVFGSINTGDSLINLGSTAATDIAILAMRVPKTIGSQFNSRGAIMDKLVTWTRDEALTKVYIIRDTGAPNLEALTWDSIPDSDLQMLVGGSGSALQTAYSADSANASNVLAEWADLEVKNVITNPSTYSKFKLTPGDILLVVVNCIGANKLSSATLYYSEQI